MFNSLGKWQKRACLVGLTGLAVAVAGTVLQAVLLAVIGFSLFGGTMMGLVLALARRTDLRTNQIKAALSRLEARPRHTESAVAPIASAPAAGATSDIFVGAEYEYSRRMASMQSHLETFALRSRSQFIRNSFARHATAGRLGYSDLLRLLAVLNQGSGTEEALASARLWRAEALLALARIAVNQRSLESDLEDAVLIFSFVERNFGTKVLGRTDRFLFLEALGAMHAHREMQKTATRFRFKQNQPVHSSLMSLNSAGLATQQAEESWVEELNRLLRTNSLAGVAFTKGATPPIDRLRTADAPQVAAGPLVSVILPTHNGSELIETALNSLLGQTWRNLEVIVVDDCSEAAHYVRLQELAAVDERVTLVRQSRNLGAYCARNLGLTVAKGEFVTVHDDDDWSHAQKIERQVVHLVENPAVVANMSLHARCTEDLEFLRINNNPRFAQPNFSSLMLRKSVIEELGGWDAVNRGADAEFRDRLVAWSGMTISAVGEVPLSFTRTRTGSLTSGEMIRGYIDSARLLYLASYQNWHRRGAETGQFALTNELERPFPVPRNMEPGLRQQHLGLYDVVFATDFRFPGGTSSLTLAEIQTSSAAGLRVGVIQLDSPLNNFSAPLAPGLFDVLSLPSVDALSLSDQADVALLVVRHPSVATFLDGNSSRLQVRRCVLVVNNPPVLSDGSGMVFDLPKCIENLDSLFAIRTDVVAESMLTRKLCKGLVPRGRLSARTWPGVVSFNSATSAAPRGVRPVLGRHSRDHELKWPSQIEEYNAAYKSSNGAFTTVFLGGSEALTKKFGSEAVDGLTVLPYGTMEVDEFLGTIHFWAYFHDDRLTESFGMAAAEAMAAGKVVFLPAYMKATFGDGAVYCQAKDVPELLAKYVQDPAMYDKQAARARQVVAENFSSDALLRRIAEFSNRTAILDYETAAQS